MTALAPVESRAALAIAEPRDIAALSDQEFERALERIEVRKTRMHRILDSYLVPEAHFGKPPGMKKPILYRAGADELMVAFGFEIITDPAAADRVTEEPDYVSVTVRRAVVDRAGRVLDRTSASCSTKEKRFKRADGTGFVFADAREALNDVWAMAEKRAKVRLTVTACGLSAWLATEEEMEKSIEVEAPLTPWTDEEKASVYAAARTKGMGKKTFFALVQETLGREKVGSGDDVVQLLAAVESWTKPGTAEKAEGESTGDSTPQVEEEPATPAEPTPDVEYHESVPATPAAPRALDSREVFGTGNVGPVLPGEIAIAQTQAGELPLGDATPRRTRNAVAEGH